MPNTTVTCHSCGGEAVLIVQEAELKLGSRSVVVDDEFMQCSTCASEFYLPGQMEETQRRAAAKARNAEGLLSPDDIREIRQSYDLSQADFEKLLGVGPKTVVRWERGTVFQNKATDSLLRLLRADRGNAEVLAERHGVALRSPFNAAAPRSLTGPSFKDPVVRGSAHPTAARDFWEGKPLVIQVHLEDVTDADRIGC